MRDSQPRTIYLKDYEVPAFLIDSTELRIELGETETRVISRLRMRRNPASRKTAPELVLHGRDLHILGLAINDLALGDSDYFFADEELTINHVPDSFIFAAEVLIRPQDNTSLEGLYKSHTMFCTQCEAEGFRKITFYLDRPDVMSEFTTTLVADKQRYPVLLSNGNPIDRGELEDGRHWQTWHDPYRKPAYLFAMVAGPLSFVEDNFTTCSGRRIALKIFVEKKDLDKCDFALQSLKKAMRWDEEKYGREYDLDIFMIVAVDDFNMGAMENKGLNIFNSAAVLARQETTTDASFQRIESIVAHEYFHNWSGNRVTCRDWFQLSLKEGFTVFRDSQFSADMNSATVKRVENVSTLRTLQFAEDAGPMAHPVQPASFMEISNFYTMTVYEKGAEVVRMIQTLLGPERFRQGCDLYFDRHDGQAVTIEDFVAAMAEVSGRDFNQFMNWYRQAGTPRLDVAGSYDAASRTYTLDFSQSCPPTPDTAQKQPFLIPVKMGLVGSKGDLPLILAAGNSSGIMGQTGTEIVLEISESHQRVVFEQVEEPPVPSLLRGLSAPVKWHFPYSREQLKFLMVRDSDGFNRWDAGQQLGKLILREMISAQVDGRNVELDTRLIDAYRPLLLDHSLDPAMVAQTLVLPTEALLSEEADVIHVQAIHDARQRARLSLAAALVSEFEQAYSSNTSIQPYAPTADQIARRSLKNMALAYLVLTGEETFIEQAHRQFDTADNMTDAYSALLSLVNADFPLARDLAKKALDDFYRQWRQEPLVVNQWLQLQATCMLPGGLERVQVLLEHEAFDIKNPNKVRALIGAFTHGNMVNFHRSDGAGYRFLGDKILELDRLNPQIASRQLTPLTRWRKYPVLQAERMQQQLQRILAQPGLSPDVYEVTSKSLK